MNRLLFLWCVISDGIQEVLHVTLVNAIGNSGGGKKRRGLDQSGFHVKAGAAKSDDPDASYVDQSLGGQEIDGRFKTSNLVGNLLSCCSMCGVVRHLQDHNSCGGERPSRQRSRVPAVS